MASFTTCSGEWLLTEQETGPLPRSSLRLTGIFVGVIVLGLIVGWAAAPGQERPETAEVGAPAPDFSAPIIGGGTFSLVAFQEEESKPVVLNLWASWCPPCREEIPEISAFADAHPEVKVIGVSPGTAVGDSIEAATEFDEELMPTYDLAFGDDAFSNAYPRLGLPATYFIDADGIVDHVVNGVVTFDSLEAWLES